jgi:conjugative relaxase-like TrwC/TraI family protein
MYGCQRRIVTLLVVDRVLSSGMVKTSSWRYYTNSVACRATDYYLGIGEAPGRWAGCGLGELGLAPGARVEEKQLEALFGRALHPVSGERLGRAWRSDGNTGYDLTFSSPKSVSALWALASSDISAAVLAAHQQAVTAGLAYLETHASWSRRGTNGVEQISSEGLSVALFDHRTSREGDPQLHTHALVLNKVRCVDGVWRTIDGREMFDHKKTAGMIYQAALRNELHEHLGVEFEPVSIDGQAEIRGAPKELLKLWSKRTKAIESEAAPKIAEYEKLLGRSLSAAERFRVTKTAVLKTRPGKTHPELATLTQSWTEEAATVGWTPVRLLRAAKVTLWDRMERPRPTETQGVVPGPRRGSVDVSGLAQELEAVLPTRGGQDSGLHPADARESDPRAAAHGDLELAQTALLAAGRKAAVFSRTDLAGHVAAHLPASGLTAAQVVARVEELTDQALALAEAVPVGHPARDLTPRASDPRYATLEVLQAEGRILSLARRGQQRGYGQVDPRHLRSALHEPGHDQEDRPQPAHGAEVDGGAVNLDAAEDRPSARRLDAGQWRAVHHLTGNGDFLDVLTAPAGAGKTSTLGVACRAWQATGYRVVGLAPSARAAAELAAATGGRADTLAKWLHNSERLDRLPTAERDWTALDDRTIVIVDEASMASTLDLDRLTAAAGKAAAKVVLVGDPSQIGVINGPGGMLAALTHAGHGITLEQIHRFTEDWERAASLQLRQGHAPCLTEYLQHGRLHPCPDSDTALSGVFQHWSKAKEDGRDALMLARTRLDVDALNQLARAAAVAAGDVTGPVTTAGDRDWQAGDLLRTRRNDRTLLLEGTVGDGHVRNGDRYRVLGPGPDAGLIVEDLSGRGRVILPAPYVEEHCEYGWASTIDSAQGATADIGIVLVRPGLDREHLYVAMTRGRHGNHAFITTDPATDPAHDHGHGTTRKKADRASQAHGQGPATDQQARGQEQRPAEPTRGQDPAPATAISATGAEPSPGPSRRSRRRPDAQGCTQDELPFEEPPVAPTFAETAMPSATPADKPTAPPIAKSPANPQPATAYQAAAANEQAARVLWQAMQQTGGQDAAHTALDAARQAARDLTERQTERRKTEARAQRDTPLPRPAEHQQTLTLIEQLRAEQQAGRAREQELWASTRATQGELGNAPKWARGRRRDLTGSLAAEREELSTVQASLREREHALDDATVRANKQAREHREAEAARQRPPLAETLAALRPMMDLAEPRPADGLAAVRRARQAVLDLQPRSLAMSQWTDNTPPSRGHNGPSRGR